MATTVHAPPPYTQQPYGNAPPPQGYVPPQPTHGYPPPVQPQPAFINVNPQPPAPSGVFVINTQQSAPPPQPAIHTVIHERPRERTNHFVHLVISLLFWPWIFVWIVICIVDGV